MKNIPWIPVVLAAFFLFSSGYYLGQQKVVKQEDTALFAPSEEANKIRIHIAGAIQKEGLYWIDRDSCVEDALREAGGCTEKADLQQINLARPLRHGEKLIIPTQIAIAPSLDTSISQTPSGTQSSTKTLTPLPPAQAQDPRININTATLDELMELPGIGPSKAKAIIDHREKNGYFISEDEIVNVPGIGPKTLENLRDQIRVN
jgi:competence protein ComEA